MGSVATDIINQVNQGHILIEIANKYQWEKISVEDQEILFSEVDNKSDDPKSENLLAVIWLMVKDNYPWDACRTLVIIYKNNKIIEKKKENLDILSKKLDKVANTISSKNPDPQKLHKYQGYYGDYNFLYGEYYEQINELHKALEKLKEACDIYQNNEFFEKAEKIRERIDFLEKIIDRRDQLIPVEQLKSQQQDLEQQIEFLTKECKEKKIQLDSITNETDKKQKQKNEIEKSINDLDAKLLTTKKEISKQQSIIEQNTKQIENTEHALHFLITLKKSSMAPLWVEVIKCALKNNRMDATSKLALEKLMIEGYPDAIPLLAEISARTPEPFTPSKEAAQSGLTRFFYLIAEAQMAREKDLMSAAQKLVEAWEGFLNSDGENG